MINFIIPDEKELFKGMLILSNLVKGETYKDTMIGPFEDFCLIHFGIIIDGKEEEKLANDFEKRLKRVKYGYERDDQLGLKFYESRDW